MALLTDGFRTMIQIRNPSGAGAGVPLPGPGVLGLPPTILFEEREVQPPELDGGGEIDTTTMRRVLWRTKQPKALLTLGDATIRVQWDPALYTAILLFANKNTQIDILFPDLSGLSYFGWLAKFTPDSNKEGDFPMAEIKLAASNQRPFTLPIGIAQGILGSEIAPLIISAPNAGAFSGAGVALFNHPIL